MGYQRRVHGQRTLKNMRLSFLSLCDPSVVPATLSLLTGFLLIFLNKFLNARFPTVYGWHLFIFSTVVLAVCSGLWCYLIRHEVGFHTTFMAIGFRVGFTFFLISELFLFLGFFWAYFNFAWSVDYKTRGFFLKL